VSRLSAEIRLRPVRFAFIVNPFDMISLTKVFQINTCLWGGKFNPIIPAIKKVPPWWSRDHKSIETAQQILDGYIDFFEPDFIVEATDGLGVNLGFEKDKIISVNEILIRANDGSERGYGLDVFDLYRDLYEAEYKFARRHEHRIIRTKAKEENMQAFVACMFGDFPQSADHGYFSKAFTEAFEPKSIELDGSAFAKLYVEGGQSPLSVGHSKIEIDYNERTDPALFVLDAHKPADLIDYWNLRAIKRDLLPIPVQWVEDLSSFAKDFIARNYRPLTGNPNGIMIQPNVMFARSIPSSKIDQLYDDYFRVDIQGANYRQDWYPAFWQPASYHYSRPSRSILAADRKSIDVNIDPEKPDIRLDSLQPKFAEKYGNKNRWVNVITLREWAPGGQVATCFPTDCRKPMPARYAFGRHDLRHSKEGFIASCEYYSSPHFLRLIDGTRAFQEWFKTEGIESIPSNAGLAAQQIIRILGGLRGAHSIAHGDIVKLLDGVSRRPHSRCIHHKEFENKIKSASKGQIWRGREFKSLVENKAVEIGLELKCAKCSSWSWQPLDKLGYSIECGLCLQNFSFPATDPNNGQNSRWSYRLVGPFALPDYARGGYAAALALRFFAVALGFGSDARMTWSTGQELDFGVEGKIEADFMFWHQRTEILKNDYPTVTVFGEAKSFGREAFEQADIERMKRLAIRFPGSICVFATMKEGTSLSDAEKSRLRKFSQWGREYVSGRRFSRAPVIVLTGTELFTAHNLNSTWEECGGRRAAFVKQGVTRTENLHTLADLTQQLYLGMDPYSEFLRAKWKLHRERTEKS